MSSSNSYIIYEGASLLDGAPIVVIATGFDSASENNKTGDMSGIVIAVLLANVCGNTSDLLMN